MSGPGGSSLRVPAGALSSPVVLTLRTATGLPLDPAAVGQAAVTIEPAGTVFASPATLVLGYDPALGPSGVPEAALRVHGLAGPQWTPVPGAVTETNARTATAAVSAAGTFGVRWAGPDAPCGTDEDRQFDFWLGNWDFLQGNLAPARNDITKTGDGCVIEESFRDPAGTTARSVSLFSRVDRLWHQTYLDSRGERIVLRGSAVDGRMVLNRTATDRFVWEPQGPATVRFYEERSADGGATWAPVFDSRYVRR